MRKTFFTLLMSLVLLPIFSNAQWSSDPAENIAAATFGDNQAIPKIHADYNGNYYVAMFSNEDNYNIRLQRLDSDGYYLWDEEGLLVSDHEQNSWISEWDMRVDNAGNCILAFADVRSGNPDIYVYKISPDGEFLWGDDGISVSPSPAEEYAPYICVSDDNNVYVTWNRPGDAISATMIQRITPEGDLPWGEEALMYSGTESYTGSRVVGAGNDFILAYYRETGPFFSPTRHIYAQKFDNAGNTIWAEDVLASDKPGISGWTDMTVASDGAAGIIIGCDDDRDGNDLGDVFVQHIPADGVLVWPVGGVELNTDNSQFHSGVRIGGMNENGDVVAGWTFKDFNQTYSGVKVQKISQAGTRLWTDFGTTISGLDDPYSLMIGCNLEDDITYVTFDKTDQDSFVNSTIYGQSVRADGVIAWSEDALISSRPSEKGHPMMSEINQEQMIVGWEDKEDDVIVRVQNLNLNGTIGVEGLYSDDATLADLTVDGETVEGFTPDIYDYTIVLPDVTPLPVVDATPEDANASVQLNQIVAVPGDATVVVTAEDGVTQLIYTVHFDSDIRVSDQVSINARIFPNPVADILQLKAVQAIHSVEVIDLTGRIIKVTEFVNQNRVSIDMTEFERGTYFVRINHTQMNAVMKL
ncbi:MAG: T9SS type A sorting domain-containing protein [Bacteroidales bacterium]|nr:T9SS type A sorting domain-containing protein [Bacteroidales bacterium]